MKKIEKVRDEIIVDSRDVDRATEIALKRDSKRGDKKTEVIDEEILTVPRK